MALSADPLARPAIRFNYLASRDDLRVMTAGVRHARRILATPALAAFSVAETRPGREVDTDEEIAEFARREGSSLYHPVGDASVMPTLTTGNTNAPTIMIGEKATDLIREEARAGAAKTRSNSPATGASQPELA